MAKFQRLTFEWDPKKANLNIRKHGISFETASQVFGDVNAITVFDENNSIIEDRYATIGLAKVGILVVVIHTDRFGRIRIISARKATSKERKQYEEGI